MWFRPLKQIVWVQQVVGVASRQAGGDDAPERGQYGTPARSPGEEFPNNMITTAVSNMPAAPSSFCRTAATGDQGDDQRQDGPRDPDLVGGVPPGPMGRR